MNHVNNGGAAGYANGRRGSKAVPTTPATAANTTRVFLACTTIFLCAVALFLLEDSATPSSRQLGSPAGQQLNPNPDYDSYYGSKDIYLSRPHLVDSSPEIDSATIDPATGLLPSRKALVISSYKDQDVSWLDELHNVSKGWALLHHSRIAPSDTDPTHRRWEVYRYVSDVPDVDDLAVANPNGREALPYLTYITDNYANLPEVVLFTHGHYQSWHQPEPLVDKIMALNLTAVQKEDYVNLRCQASHGCTEDSMFYIKNPRGGDVRGGNYIRLIWQELMQDEVGPIADVIARPCCAQFAVNKQAILRHSLNFWNSLRSPLETRKPGDEGWRGKSDYDVGLKYEMFWHVLMGKDPMQ